MRSILAAALVIGAFMLVTIVNAENRVELDPFTYDYVVRNFQEDTHSRNGVAAVLLNYRVYDTMFEALILLAAIIGMTQFLPRSTEPSRREAQPEQPTEHTDGE